MRAGDLLIQINSDLIQWGYEMAKVQLERNKIEFEIIGRRNSLGKPSVCIARRIASDDDPTPGAAAVYCLLDCWSLHKGLLNLDLPPAYFSQPGKLYVWFLRDGKVLWEEVEDWPGYKGNVE